MTDSAEKRKKAVILLIVLTVVAICIGTAWIILFSLQAENWLPIFGVSALLAGAFLITGLLIGFIFGVAKPEEAGKKHISTNLEQISEWLTKVIVGAGLAQLATLPTSLTNFAAYVNPRLGSFKNGEIFAIGILIYYLTCGFLSGYLLTKLYFLGLLENDSSAAEGTVPKSVESR